MMRQLQATCVVVLCTCPSFAAFGQQVGERPTGRLYREDELATQRGIGASAADRLANTTSRTVDIAVLAPMLREMLEPRVPTEYLDEAFEQYVDIRLLHTARKQMDPALLTDVALQLAKGEEILLRPHKVVSADALLALAVEWSIEKQDKQTLERLKHAARKLGKDELGAIIADQGKLFGDSRNDVPGFEVSIESMSNEEYSKLRTLLADLREARMLHDWAAVQSLSEESENIQLTEKQRQVLSMILATNRAAGGQVAESEQATADILNALGADSRADPNKGRQIARGFYR